MTLNYSTALRNAQLDALETLIGVSPLLRLYSGSKPVDAATAASGTLLAEMVLPSDWLAAAANGAKSKSGTWQDLSADAVGTIGYFRVYESTGSTCHMQGSVTLTGSGGDMTVDNTSVQVGQQVVVSTFTITRGNA